ncbi:peptidase S14 [Rhodobacteraceae bacterium R_SAG4]|nr:peptidase S14 [Rhodobacteraceae bacterium R_SAG4]
MTTIVYRDGYIAADTRAYSGGSQPMGQKQKINRVQFSDGTLVSFGISTPHPGLSEEIRDWFASEKSGDAEPNLNGRGFDCIEVRSDGSVYFYNDSFIPTGPLAGDYFAIGSGAEYALGAMAMGADAARAVQVAAEFDVWTGGVVQHVCAFPEEPDDKALNIEVIERHIENEDDAEIPAEAA